MIKSNKWFAWYPVYDRSGKWYWLCYVMREWNPKYRIQILTSDDPGEYVGGWVYKKDGE